LKRVLIVVSYLKGGGAERIAQQNLKCLLQTPGISCALLTCDTETEMSKKIPVYVARDFRKNSFIFSKAIQSLWCKDNEKLMYTCLEDFQPDIIHFHDFVAFSPSIFHALSCYKAEKHCKIVMTNHTYSFICTNDSLYNYSKQMLCDRCIGTFDKSIIRDNCANNRAVSFAKYLQKNRFRPYMRNLVDVHISPSDFLAEKLCSTDPTLHVQIIPNPCIDRIQNSDFTERQKKIVYFGRISREKNIVAFARIYSSISTPYHLDIIGDGPKANELKEYLKTNNPGNIAFTHGFLSSEKLYEKIKNAQFSVLPSIWYENSPVSIVESINLGLVPLVSNIGGMKELVNKCGVGKTFDPVNTAQMQALIKQLPEIYLQEKPKLKEAIVNLDAFLLDSYKEKILQLYDSL